MGFEYANTRRHHAGVGGISYLQAGWLSVETRCGNIQCASTLLQCTKAVRDVTQQLIDSPRWPRTTNLNGRVFRVHIGALVRKGVDVSFMGTWGQDLRTSELDDWMLEETARQASAAGYNKISEAARLADALKIEDTDDDDYDIDSDRRTAREDWWEARAHATFNTIAIYSKSKVVHLVRATREDQLALYGLCWSAAITLPPYEGSRMLAAPMASDADAVVVYRLESPELSIVEGFVR